MNGKNLVVKALKGFNKAKDLLQKAIESDTKEIDTISTKITDLSFDKKSHETNMKYASKVLGKLEDLLT